MPRSALPLASDLGKHNDRRERASRSTKGHPRLSRQSRPERSEPGQISGPVCLTATGMRRTTAESDIKTDPGAAGPRVGKIAGAAARDAAGAAAHVGGAAAAAGLGCRAHAALQRAAAAVGSFA